MYQALREKCCVMPLLLRDKIRLMVSRREVEPLARLTSDEGILTAYIRIAPRLAYDAGQPVAKLKG